MIGRAQFLGQVSLLACWIALSAIVPSGAAGDPSETSRKAVNLEALSRLKGLDLEANPSVKAVVLKLLEQVQGTPDFVEIVRDFHIQGQTQPLLALAAAAPSTASAAEAMRLVLQSGETNAVLSALAGTNAAQITEALGNTGEKQVVPLLQPVVADSARPVALRVKAVEALAKTQDGAAALLELARQSRLPEDVRLTASSELNAVRWESIKSQAAQLLPKKSGNTEPLPPIAELVKLKGDPKNGAAIFRRDTVGCYKCHQVNGEGTDFGPNLSEIGTKLAKDAIYQAILDPSAGISFGYEAWQLEFKNGDDAQGLVVSETTDELALKTVGGLVTRYKKAEIVRRTKQKLSIMPAGLEQTMTRAELIDLVEYLASLRKTAQ